MDVALPFQDPDMPERRRAGSGGIRFVTARLRIEPRAMDRAARIQDALARRDYSPYLSERIEKLLDGREDRTRLTCCHSGCYVCVEELLAILSEVEGPERIPGAFPPAPPSD